MLLATVKNVANRPRGDTPDHAILCLYRPSRKGQEHQDEDSTAANDGEIRKVECLTEQERRWIIDYCRYRLGIDTALIHQDDVETCGKK
ncbi:hypothetical protein C4K35_3664 [Pseudomonas chlororaphis subsp. piscium]|nr:hypothetical protein C4K35_3664 [Pseudomonas chlororaphis subsp. piscium]AZC57818.1 hypothetical protein C4K34_3655 [Pseudomonas chlororaphis subsp. piscium]AZC64046.1 hypothetical protein C4K33_3556 [Pseudomonas chlororaphis subsp. piscium]AZC70270.1 hypothetical protein C4K32_3610 [Pseudomonas chlororaphis subsp. piscium]AZC76535.1 hypothetical protein C4K31_3634 [Pseudomonas chlororaphis subsp. piscium]